MPGIESAEMIEAVKKLAAADKADFIILEPIIGRGWKYDKDGKLLEKDKPVYKLESAIKQKRYTICTHGPTPEGLWTCSVIHKGLLIEDHEEDLG